MKHLLTFALLLASAGRAEDLPLLGLAHVGIRTTDLEKARAFYGSSKFFRAFRPIRASP